MKTLEKLTHKEAIAMLLEIEDAMYNHDILDDHAVVYASTLGKILYGSTKKETNATENSQ